MINIPGVIYFLVLLKPLQVEQNKIINQLLNKKALILNGRNNQQYI